MTSLRFAWPITLGSNVDVITPGDVNLQVRRVGEGGGGGCFGDEDEEEDGRGFVFEGERSAGWTFFCCGRSYFGGVRHDVSCPESFTVAFFRLMGANRRPPVKLNYNKAPPSSPGRVESMSGEKESHYYFVLTSARSLRTIITAHPSGP